MLKYLVNLYSNKLANKFLISKSIFYGHPFPVARSPGI